MRDEGTRLTGMVDQVLRFSEFEAERMPLEKRALLVSDVMEQIEREMRPVAERQGCEWDATYENGTFAGDRGALHVAVRNLVELLPEAGRLTDGTRAVDGERGVGGRVAGEVCVARGLVGAVVGEGVDDRCSDAVSERSGGVAGGQVGRRESSK